MGGLAGNDITFDDWLKSDMMRVADRLNPLPQSLPANQGWPAAVLVGLQEKKAGWHVVMTRRASHLNHHAGQISFPGGKVDPVDVSLMATALREAEEEIAVPPAAVAIIGALDMVTSPVGFLVQPVVGIVAPETTFVAAPDEVDEVLLLPLEDVLDPARHRRETYLREGVRREIWVIDHINLYLWGLSASILVDLAGRLR
tara:strand:+ start:225 stop:824 length:600 start_codon:yes stop_codon:yes gene_type:complete